MEGAGGGGIARLAFRLSFSFLASRKIFFGKIIRDATTFSFPIFRSKLEQWRVVINRRGIIIVIKNLLSEIPETSSRKISKRSFLFDRPGKIIKDAII